MKERRSDELTARREPLQASQLVAIWQEAVEGTSTDPGNYSAFRSSGRSGGGGKQVEWTNGEGNLPRRR